MKKRMRVLSVLLAVASMLQLSTVSFAVSSEKISPPAEQEFILPVSSKDAQNNFENFASAKVDFSASKSRNDVKVATIVGQVYDADGNSAISNALVRIESVGIEIRTDHNGAFEIANVPEGHYDVEVVVDGYNSSHFDNMPAFSVSGAEFYYLPISKDQEMQFDYAADLNGTNDDRGHEVAVANDSRATSATIYTLKSYTVNYNGNVYSFGNNINNYLYCVVPNEMVVTGLTDAQAIEAYKAQAVASRGYADAKVRQGIGHMSSGYSLCAGTHCQAFVPYYTNANAITAVDAVTNQVLTYNGYRSITEYHGKCQGTVTNYPQPGSTSISDVRTCNAHSAATGDEVAHNRGMCQTGAKLMAKNNKTYQEILSFYYASCELITANPISYNGINPGETIRFSTTGTSIEFLTYAPVSGSYTISVGQAGSTAYSTKIEVHNVSRSSSHDVTVGTLVQSSTTGSLTTSLVAKKESRIKVTCTSASSMTGMLKVKCNAANHAAGLGIDSQGKYDYFVVGVVEKVFKFTPTTSGTYTIQTNKPGTTSVDTYLELRNSSFSLLAQDDDSGDSLYSSISYSLTKGTTYYIVVTSYSHHANAINGNNMQCGLRISKG